MPVERVFRAKADIRLQLTNNDMWVLYKLIRASSELARTNEEEKEIAEHVIRLLDDLYEKEK